MVSLIKPLILASGSPRRKKMLHDLGWSFEVRQSTVKETVYPGKTPAETVMMLATSKAKSVARELEVDAIIAAADTIVVVENDILNKPRDTDEARAMLNRLSDRTHEVYTGFTLYDVESKNIYSDYAMTEVTFRRLTPEEIDVYVRSGAPMDKAGSYGIQGDISATFAEKINGCFYNVVGLPLSKFYTAMREFQEQLGLE